MRIAIPGMLVLQPLCARKIWTPGILTSHSLSKVLVLGPGCFRFIWGTLNRYQCQDPSPAQVHQNLGCGLGQVFLFFKCSPGDYHSLEKESQSKAPAPELVNYI